MLKSSGWEKLSFIAVLGTAIFFRFHDFNLGSGAAAALGVLTVLGLYLLVRELYDWRLAALASFMAAISFWAVAFSRQQLSINLVPFALVWSFYFLWRGLKRGFLMDYLWAGLFAGFGFYSSAVYWLTPIIGFILFVNYWAYLRKDFGHDKYEHSRNRFLAGISLTTLVAFFTAVPLIWNYVAHPAQFSAAAAVLATGISWTRLWPGIGKTLSMFNFNSMPLIGWPIGVFFLIGFIKELWHWLRRKHGHLSPSHTLLFSWFFVMLVPGFVSLKAPDALVTLGAMPVVVIFTARGIWWIFESLAGWHEVNYPLKEYHQRKETTAFAVWVLIVLLIALGAYNYFRYFQAGAAAPAASSIFNIK